MSNEYDDMPEDCLKCVNGQKLIELDREHRKNEMIEVGRICVLCTRNGIGKTKSKIYGRLYPGFQSIDCFQEVKS